MSKKSKGSLKNKEKDTSELYASLSKYSKSGDFEKALKICHKILNVDSSDFTAFHSKIICLLHSEKFPEVLRTCSDHENKFPIGELAFEKGYAHYRLNELNEALEVLSSCNDVRSKELRAQIYYRLEDYSTCYSLYRDIVKGSKDDEFETEHETNMAAAAVHLTNIKMNESSNHQSYEYIYNQACRYLGESQWSLAEEYLVKAEKSALEYIRSSNEEDEDEDLSQNEDSECGIIRAQLAYSLQMQGRVKESQAIYNQVLKSKPSDLTLIAVISNNLLVLNKDQNIFDSKKRIKAAMMEGLENKLTVSQRRIIGRNNALLSMYSNQVSATATLLLELQKSFSLEKKEVDIINAGALSRVGRTSEAIELLVNSETDTERVLIASSILLEQKKISEMLELMETKLNDDTKFRHGILSTMVALYLSIHRNEDAASLLQRASSVSTQQIIWQKTAEIHLKCGNTSLAVDCLEKLLVSDPQNPSHLAKLVLAYTKFDISKALSASKNLPKFKENHVVNLDSLESSAFLGGCRKTPKMGGGILSPGKNIAVKSTTKKKKKRKIHLPKNFNPNVEPDPERWLPRRERTGYRKPKRDRRNKGEKFTGAQGNFMGLTAEVFDYSSKKAGIGLIPKSPIGSGPKGTTTTRKPINKKKKKKGGF